MTTALINVCRGTCCRRFYINYDFLDNPNAAELPMILNMVIPLSISEPNHLRKHAMLCTCRHFDTETSRCTIYARRPMICRGYPYGTECDLDPDCHFSLDDFDLAKAVRWLEYLVYRWRKNGR